MRSLLGGVRVQAAHHVDPTHLAALWVNPQGGTTIWWACTWRGRPCRRARASARRSWG